MPITLSNGFQQQQQTTSSNGASLVHNSQLHHPLELTKPILFDCDYQYDPEVDARLTIRWFRNKESEPFYQWLPELNVRHFADWIKPLVNETFISDPSDPLKRFRSLLIKRLSMNLTAHYTCIVSSLAGQDMRQASLVVYQPPRSFTFEQRIFPVPTIPPSPNYYPAQTTVRKNQQLHQAVIYRPPNNDNNQTSSSTNGNETRIVYTHDGRPIKRPVNKHRSRRQQINYSYPIMRTTSGKEQVIYGNEEEQNYANQAMIQQMRRPRFSIQLHQFQCQASQVTPRPVIVLTVKRDSDSIAQYLHESSSVSIRPYQVNQADYYYYSKQSNKLPYNSASMRQLKNSSSIISGEEFDLQFTLYDINVSATVALNVTLPPTNRVEPLNDSSSMNSIVGGQFPAQMNTILNFKRGQRMSFECHLEITGTEFEQRKRININEEG